MSFHELKGRLVMEASCLCGNAKESCGVCNTNKGYLLLLGRTVSLVARPDVCLGGEGVLVAACLSVLQIKGRVKCCGSHRNTLQQPLRCY